MNENTTRSLNEAFLDFKRYEQEILLDTYDEIINSKGIISKKTVFQLGNNEIHHIVKYHHKIILNTLYFNNEKIFEEYHQWLYRVYFYRDIDLDFFNYLNIIFQKVSNRYINSNVYVYINEYFNFILKQHIILKDGASKKRQLIDNKEESINFANSLISGNREEAYKLCKAKSNTLEEFLSFYDEIVSSAMKYIGFVWETQEVSIAKEHIATNTLDDILSKLIDSFKKENKNSKHIFLCSAPNELHGLGVKIASKIFQKLGFKVTNLGVNIPAKEIKKAIIEFRPDYIIFSAALQTSLVDIALLIEDIKKDSEIFISAPKIVIAGNAFEKILHPAKFLQVDFYLNGLKDIKKIFY